MNEPIDVNKLRQQNVHIMGLGWLGLALAKTLMNMKANVSGSVRDIDKQKRLQHSFLSVDHFDLYKSINTQTTCSHQALATRFENASLVLNIPPGRKHFTKESFVSNMTALIDYAMASGLRQLVFISTTSVFGNQYTIVDSSTALLPNTESGEAHQEIEAHLASHYSTRSKILRPSGLVGPNVDETCYEIADEPAIATRNSHSENVSSVSAKPSRTCFRHPIFTLCHKSDIPNGKDPVNLIHRDDVITAILTVLTKDISAHAFNLSAGDHPCRQEYYQWCAKQLSLPQPHFLPDTKKRQLGKLIDASRSFTDLGFTPQYASPYAML